MEQANKIADRLQMLLDNLRNGQEEIVEFNIILDNSGKAKYEITSYLRSRR